MATAVNMLVIVTIVAAIAVLPFEWSSPTRKRVETQQGRGQLRVSPVLKSMTVAVALLLWPLLAWYVGRGTEFLLPTVLFYAIVAKFTGYWGPICGLVMGGAVAVLLILFGLVGWDVGAIYFLSFVCLAGGTLIGAFASEMKRLDRQCSVDSRGDDVTDEAEAN
jgi:hypothetical protein